MKKKSIIAKLKGFFERFFGIGDTSFAKEKQKVIYLIPEEQSNMVAEKTEIYDEHLKGPNGE